MMFWLPPYNVETPFYFPLLRLPQTGFSSVARWSEAHKKVVARSIGSNPEMQPVATNALRSHPRR
jgi:hypothetical protein